MEENVYSYSYQSSTMRVVAFMFLILFSLALAYAVLVGSHILPGGTSVTVIVSVGAALLGALVVNMETGVELTPEGMRFTYLIRPSRIVPYADISRIGVRMLRGLFYCFIRYGSGFIPGTFFPVDYYGKDNRANTDVFLRELAQRAGLQLIGRTPFGAPLYTRLPVE